MEIRPKGLAPFLAAALLSCAAGTARADEPHARTSSLSWVRLPGADACVATQDLAKQVEGRLGRAVFASAAVADVSVEGRIEPAADHHGFRAVLTLRDAHGTLLGTRELARPDASCDGMREPLALVIAVMIDPDAALGPNKPAPPPAPEPPPPVIVEKPVYIQVPAPPQPPRPVWRIDVGPSAATNLGLMPAPNLGLSASGLLTPPGVFPLEGFGALWFDDRTASAGANPSGTGGPGAASFFLAYVGGGLCPLHHEGGQGGAVRLYGCAIGEIGVFSGTPPGGSQMSHAYLAGGLEGRIGVRLVAPVELRLGVDGVVPLFRPSTNEGGDLGSFRPSVVGGAADLGLGVLLP